MYVTGLFICTVCRPTFTYNCSIYKKWKHLLGNINFSLVWAVKDLPFLNQTPSFLKFGMAGMMCGEFYKTNKLKSLEVSKQHETPDRSLSLLLSRLPVQDHHQSFCICMWWTASATPLSTSLHHLHPVGLLRAQRDAAVQSRPTPWDHSPQPQLFGFYCSTGAFFTWDSENK